MYNRPIFTIASYIFRPVARYFGMQLNFLPIYNLLWNATSGILSTIGTMYESE